MVMWLIKRMMWLIRRVMWFVVSGGVQIICQARDALETSGFAHTAGEFGLWDLASALQGFGSSTGMKRLCTLDSGMFG